MQTLRQYDPPIVVDRIVSLPATTADPIPPAGSPGAALQGCCEVTGHYSCFDIYVQAPVTWLDVTFRVTTQTGPITDIHIWGSWLEDEYPDGGRGFPDPANVHFRLSIHSDIPASQSPTGYSMPGEPLWMDSIDGRNWRLWAESDEEFFAPNTVGIMGTDTQVIQYNFSDFEEPFEQERDTIYWLSVTAFPENMPNGGQPPTTYFGWKSSDMHWNDQAVFWVERSDGTSTTPQELIGPTGKSLDLAFVITPEPATMSLLALGGVAMLRRRRRRKIA